VATEERAKISAARQIGEKEARQTPNPEPLIHKIKTLGPANPDSYTLDPGP